MLDCMADSAAGIGATPDRCTTMPWLGRYSGWHHARMILAWVLGQLFCYTGRRRATYYRRSYTQWRPAAQPYRVTDGVTLAGTLGRYCDGSAGLVRWYRAKQLGQLCCCGT